MQIYSTPTLSNPLFTHDLVSSPAGNFPLSPGAAVLAPIGGGLGVRRTDGLQWAVGEVRDKQNVFMIYEICAL